MATKEDEQTTETDPKPETETDGSAAEVEKLRKSLLTAKRRIDAADKLAKAAGSEWDTERERYVGGIDFGKAREALDKVAKFAEFDPKKEADKILEQRAAELKEQYEGRLKEEVAPREERIQALESKLTAQLRDRSLSDALDAVKALPENKPVLMEFGKKLIQMESVDEGKDFRAVVLTDAGQPDEYVDQDGNVKRRSIPELGGLLRQRFPALFAGTDANGSDARPSNTTGSTGGSLRRKSDAKSVKEKVAYIKTNGPEAWEQLPA